MYRRAFKPVEPTLSRDPSVAWEQQRKLSPMQGGTTLSKAAYMEEAGKTSVGNQPMKQWTGVDVDAPRAGEEALAPGTHYDTSPAAMKKFDQLNKALRRELTPEEWARLSAPQQQQVQFNAKLLNAYDTDQTDSRTNRSNMHSLIADLGLDANVAGSIDSSLRSGVGPATRYNDLFGPSLSPSPTGFSGGGGSFDGTEKISNTLTARQQQINQISGKLDNYLASTASADAANELPGALARKDEYTFETPYAKEVFEKSFDYLINPDGLTSLDWPSAAQGLVDVGFNPDDFKSYMRDRVQTLPKIAGQLDLETLNTWFGE
jgi:hypothetical protein